MQLSVSISYLGQCEEAFRLYAACLGGELKHLLTWGDSPAAASQPAMREQVMHATLGFGDAVITGSDAPPESYRAPQGFAVQINLSDRAEAERIYAALSEGGVIVVPLGKTFWAELYAVFTDRFGTPWKINCSEARGAE